MEKISLVRVRNFVWRIVNLFRLLICGIKHGKHTIIHGNLGITVHPGGGVFL